MMNNNNYNSNRKIPHINSGKHPVKSKVSKIFLFEQRKSRAASRVTYTSYLSPFPTKG